MTLPGSDGKPRRSEYHQEVSLTAKSVAPDGVLTTTARWHRVWGTTDDLGRSAVEFDSAKWAPDDPARPILVKLLAGREVLIRIEPNGRVESIRGTGIDVAEALKRVPEEGGLRASFVESYSDERLTKGLGLLLAILPGEPLRVGEVWRATTDLTGFMGAKLVCATKYTLLAADADVARVRVEGEIALPPEVEARTDSNDPRTREMIAGMVLEEGRTEGTVSISRADGHVTEQKLKVSTRIRLPGPGGTPPVWSSIETLTLTRLGR